MLCKCHISPHVSSLSTVSPGEGLLSGIADRHKEGNSVCTLWNNCSPLKIETSRVEKMKGPTRVQLCNKADQPWSDLAPPGTWCQANPKLQEVKMEEHNTCLRENGGDVRWTEKKILSKGFRITIYCLSRSGRERIPIFVLSSSSCQKDELRRGRCMTRNVLS